MSIGWKIWFALLIVAALYGLVMIGDAQEAADVNESLATAAPQQTVVGLWQLADLTAIVVYELIIGVVAVASLGLLLISRDEKAVIEIEEPPSRGAHVESDRSGGDRSG